MDAADPLLLIVPNIGGDAASMGSPPASGSSDPPRVGAGLVNLGNTCFLNSILQCLMHTGPLVHRILQIKHSCSQNGDNEEFCSICCLKELIYNCLFSRNFVVSPKKFTENLSKIAPSFQPGEEEDAHEFLGSMLNSLDECCRVGGTKEKKPSDDDSIVNQVFGGSVCSQLRCLDCGYCSKTLDPFLDLSLEISDANTIEDALASYTKVEPIEGQFTCEGCKAQVSMEKQLKLERVPQVVTLHLKRFQFTGLYFEKIYKHVEYPLELDFHPFLSCPEDNVDLKYDLYAVVVHLGSIESGHYLCCVRSSMNTWNQMDDSMVTCVSENNVLNEGAYILFYVRRGSSCWLSNLVETSLCLVPPTESPMSVLDPVRSDRSPPSAGGEAGCSSTSSRTTTPDGSTKNVNRSTSSSFASTSFAATYHNDAGGRRAAISSGTTCPHLSNTGLVADFSSLSTLPSHDRSEPAAIQPPMTLAESIMEAMFADDEEDGGGEKGEEIRAAPQHVVEQRCKRDADFVMRDPREQGPALKLLRGMTGSRRQGLMSCLDKHTMNKQGRRMALKRMHRKPHAESTTTSTSDRVPSSDRHETPPQPTPPSQSDRWVLSPGSIRRGLFRDDDDDGC